METFTGSGAVVLTPSGNVCVNPESVVVSVTEGEYGDQHTGIKFVEMFTIFATCIDLVLEQNHLTTSIEVISFNCRNNF